MRWALLCIGLAACGGEPEPRETDPRATHPTATVEAASPEATPQRDAPTPAASQDRTRPAIARDDTAPEAAPPERTAPPSEQPPARVAPPRDTPPPARTSVPPKERARAPSISDCPPGSYRYNECMFAALESHARSEGDYLMLIRTYRMMGDEVRLRGALRECHERGICEGAPPPPVGDFPPLVPRRPPSLLDRP